MTPDAGFLLTRPLLLFLSLFRGGLAALLALGSDGASRIRTWRRCSLARAEAKFLRQSSSTISRLLKFRPIGQAPRAVMGTR